ncbi:MAG: hypothetical protein KDC44_02160 [Phaeodactylibacter sp.]|nr:hypothetical protein [Phaeodactylibacter sp.]
MKFLPFIIALFAGMFQHTGGGSDLDRPGGQGIAVSTDLFNWNSGQFADTPTIERSPWDIFGYLFFFPGVERGEVEFLEGFNDKENPPVSRVPTFVSWTPTTLLQVLPDIPGTGRQAYATLPKFLLFEAYRL